MKARLFGLLLWIFCVTPWLTQAQNDEVTGWVNAGGGVGAPVLIDGSGGVEMAGQPAALVAGDSIAEAITPEIEALARDLENDPQRIFDYVHDHIRYLHYFGAKKGAQLTLLEGSGNDFDQCALLIALLQAAGYTNATYQFGIQKVPYQSDDHRDYCHWLGISKPNTNWNDSYAVAWSINWYRGYPYLLAYPDDSSNFAFHRLWVSFPWNGTNYVLDPAFRVNEPSTGLDLHSAIGMDSNAVWQAAGGTVSADYVQSLTESTLRNKLRDYTTNLLAYLRSNAPNAAVEDILGGWRAVSTARQPLSTQTPWPVDTHNNLWPVEQWQNIPTNWIARLTVAFGSTNKTFFVPELQGQRLSLNFTNGQSQLWLEDTQVLSQANTLTNSQINVTLKFDHPHKEFNLYNNTWSDSNRDDQSASTLYRTNGTYALLYAFDTSPAVLRKRQEKLDAYRQQGLADSSREVLSETLNVMGLDWMLQTELFGHALSLQNGTLPLYHHRLGRMAQEPSWGYYVDVYLQLEAVMATDTNQAPANQAFEVEGYFGSAMEHGVIEQLQASNLVAASTVKMLQVANTNAQRIYLTTSSNWASVRPNLTNYDTNYLAGLVNGGHQLLLPQDGKTQLAGANSWKGYGIVDRNSTSSSVTMGLLIQGGYSGGFAGFSGSAVSPSYVWNWSYSQPTYFNAQPASLPPTHAADPVNMADGSFTVNETDLSLGQPEPHGLSFTRHYSSSRRYHNLAGLAPGWVHNYYFNLNEVSAPQPSLGQTTPAQMAPMLVATRAALEFYDTNPNAKNWATIALIAKWGVDQLCSNAVSVTLGDATLQFVKQPDGSITPPANCAMTLFKTNGGYRLQERHGKIFKFNSLGALTNLADPYGRSLDIGYDSSNRVQTVIDWTNRTLTLNYLGGVLTNVTDSTGRTVNYGYAGTNLTSVTDPENKTSTYTYDTNHQITASFDALGQLVASNVYNGFGRVTTQYTQGDPNKLWRIFWSGWQTVEQDPAGSKQRFFYDDKTRLIAQQDALGNLSQTLYDGQDHVVTNISPLKEISRFIYDGSHNLTCVFDPLGYSNQFFYDTQNRLYRSVDARGNPSTFGYNAQFSLTGSTNGAGDWVMFDYNGDGTLHTRTDPGGTNTFGYDNYGQLSSVIYPGSLGTEGFFNSATGDVLSHTNARGFPTSFLYNSRRQLTNTVGPTNLTASLRYDAVGNLQWSKDPRGFTNVNTWSPTRKLLATTLPATPQGTPVVTNLYDSRDWLSQTINNPQSAVSAAVTYTNDAAGRLLVATGPLPRPTRYGYDADGRRTATTNAELQVTRQQWDARGQMTGLTDPTTHTVLSGYDPAGNQITLTNRRSKGWQFQFDGANRLTNTTTPMQHATQLAYDSRGLLRTVREPSTQTTTNFYDARGRLTNVTDAVGVRLYSFDANNNLTGITIVGQASRLSWGYDAYDRVSAFTNADGYVIQYRYDANGNLTNLAYPGGKNVYYAYDSLNRLTNVTDWTNRVTKITYDLASRVTSITRPNNTVGTNNYDAAGETTNIVEKTTTGFPIAFFTLGWTNSGRVAWEFAAPLPHTNPPPTRNMGYDGDNCLTNFNGQTVARDDDGNMTSGPLTNSSLVTYGYDARNRLFAAGGLNYGYDPAGNRTSVTNGTNVVRFVVNPNATLPQTLIRIKSDGSQTFYVYGLGLLYEVNFDSGGIEVNTRTYHYDYRGSTVAITDANGMPTDRVQYSLYGMLTYRSGSTDTPCMYNGRYGVMSDVNGLLYMQARYYNPYICRFINPDPAGFGGGLNWYAYADGNPVSMVDPFGLGAVEAATGGSWLSQIYSGLGIDNSMAAQGRREEGLIGAANFLSLGIAEDFSASVFGQNLHGGAVGRVERGIATFNFAVAVLPVGRIAEAGARIATGAAEIAAGAAPRAYSVAFEMQLASTELGLSRRAHFTIANDSLQAERAVNPALAELVSAPAGSGLPPGGWAWQHATIGQGGGRAGVLQLVPRSQHTSGSPFWPLLHPLPGGAGGYSQWAIPAGAPPN